MKKLLALSIALIVFGQVLSQENYIPGYIINLDGDTAKGFINYQNWKSCPDKISFKATSAGSEKDYRPSAIKGFGVSGKIYESALVQIEVSPSDKQNLNYDQAFNYRTDTVFLWVRFRGEKSLYLYIDKFKKDQFYILEDTGFVLLSYKQYLVETDNYTHIYNAENNKYKGQLKEYLKDCPALIPKIDNAGYYTSSIEKLFEEYSKCKGENYEFVRKKEGKRVEFGVVAGVTMTWIDYDGTISNYIASVDDQLSTQFSVGMVFDFIRIKTSRKWSWSNEFIITSFHYEGQYDIYPDENNYTKAHTTLGGGYFKWHSLARYKFPIGHAALYINAGPTLGVGGLVTNEVFKETNFYGQKRTASEEAIKEVRGLEVGLTGGLGLRWKDFTLESRYEYGTGISDQADLTARTNRVYALLGYRF